MPKPKFFLDRDAPSTRARSGKQESQLAKVLNGTATVNSGATFGQNDVLTDYAEIEAKTTAKSSFSINIQTWEKLTDRCKSSKIPIMCVKLEKHKKDFVVLSLEDFIMLVEHANREK